MGFLIGIFARMGLPERFRRLAALVTAIIAAAALCALLWTCWLNNHDSEVIDQHEAGITKQVTEATTAANATANANDTKRQADNARADEQLRGAIDDAEAKHPEAARAAAGPVTSAALDRLRARQAKARTTAGR